MQYLTIHCKPSMLSTIKELDLEYKELINEVDVIIPYTIEAEDINNSISDDAEFVEHYGLDYDQVNCIELI